MEFSKEELFVEWVDKDSLDKLNFLDVGANKGFYSEMLLNRIGNKIEKLYCFEPVKKNFDICTNKFKENESVELFMYACSNSNGIKNFFEITANNVGDEGLSSLIKREVFKNYNCKEISVECIVLNDFLKIENDKDFFVKVDVEGHELEVFEGMSSFFEKGKIKYLQFEYGNCLLEQNKNLKDILVFLEKYPDYKIFDFLEPNFLTQITVDNLDNYINNPWCNLYIIKNK